MRKAKVYMQNELAGYLTKTEDGYSFKYDVNYLTGSVNKPVSLTLPIQEKQYVSKTLFPFFDDLIPEGWLLEIAEKNWKLNARDRMGLLIACCRDCIGAVRVEEDNS
jgi:serine/threonine-protein kinase HipA